MLCVEGTEMRKTQSLEFNLHSPCQSVQRRYVYKNIHSSIVCGSEKLETTYKLIIKGPIC